MGLINWTPFCTAMGLLHLLLFGLQHHTPWGWEAWAYPSEGGSGLQLFSSLTLHLNWQHLTNNAFCLFAFGTALESRIGTPRTIIIYLLSGIGGNLLFAFAETGSAAVGASGCLFGVICSLIFVDPKSLVITPGAPLPIPIFIYGFFFIGNEIMALPTQDAIAHTAHIGGGLAGALVGKALISFKKAESAQ